ncbi:glycosyltransferase family 4 protein [Methylotetracoccus oryzae]|uniref:glycosyltransferase family 4 protein n=1 Tax=Methylotetracoccus oryzae TaxID=1919059 RepID=UPI00111919CF|nr:glycosyltransferase family 4 protein [Methylotetracoccus oryzae]
MHVIALGFRGIDSVEGGIETHAQALYPLLAQMGCKVEVLSRRRHSPTKVRHEFRGVHVTPLWAPRGKGIEAFVHSLIGLFYAAFKRPDLIHIHGIGPALMAPLARLARLPVVITHHGQDYDAAKWGGFAQWVLRTGEWAGVTFANQRIVVSEQLRASVETRFKRECIVIRNSVAAARPTPETTLLSSLGLTSRRYVIEVARFTEHKGQDLLIRAFSKARLNNWKLVLVGGADRLDPFNARVNELASKNDNVVLAGFRTGNELAELYSHAGMFVLPSSYEGMPIAALEALSYRLPVILSDIPAHIELALPPSHYFKSQDCDALSDRIIAMAESCDRAGIRELMARILKSIPDWNEVAQRTLEVYRAVAPPRDRL